MVPNTQGRFTELPTLTLFPSTVSERENFSYLVLNFRQLNRQNFLYKYSGRKKSTNLGRYGFKSKFLLNEMIAIPKPRNSLLNKANIYFRKNWYSNHLSCKSYETPLDNSSHKPHTMSPPYYLIPIINISLYGVSL